MRSFKSKHGLMAAIIVGFSGSNVILTDDDEEINVGGTWIGQRMPKVGDAIFVNDGVYGLMDARQVAERFEIPEPVGCDPQVAEPELWVLLDADTDRFITQRGDGYTTSRDLALTFLSEQEAVSFREEKRIAPLFQAEKFVLRDDPEPMPPPAEPMPPPAEPIPEITIDPASPEGDSSAVVTLTDGEVTSVDPDSDAVLDGMDLPQDDI